MHGSQRPPVEVLLVDLDDCLYECPQLSQLVAHKIRRYMVEQLGIGEAEVQERCSELYLNYGTTMAGLVVRERCTGSRPARPAAALAAPPCSPAAAAPGARAAAGLAPPIQPRQHNVRPWRSQSLYPRHLSPCTGPRPRNRL